MDNAFVSNIMTQGVTLTLKILGALIVWIVGSWLIGMSRKLVSTSMTAKKLDMTLIKYVSSTIDILLKVILIVAIFSYFGIETTTIAGLLAGLGLAIGTMWGGMLSNLAAGSFLVFLKPFKVGDFVNAGDVIGTVHEVGMFVTTIDTMDNVRTYVGNNKIFSGNIQNFTANPYRRVDLVAQLNHGADHNKAIALLKERIAKIPNVINEPLPVVEILEFNLAGPVLAVRPFVHNDNYWQVYFDTNRVIRESFGEAGFPVPEKHLVMRNS
ncbi:MAG: mechanosensitive ion channel family protein [Candidatus Xenobiia bacterium LiM19]